MHSFLPLYVPVGVGTFHMESARACFEASRSLLLSIDPSFVCPEDILLSTNDVAAFLSGKDADLIVFACRQLSDRTLDTSRTRDRRRPTSAEFPHRSLFRSERDARVREKRVSLRIRDAV